MSLDSFKSNGKNLAIKTKKVKSMSHTIVKNLEFDGENIVNGVKSMLTKKI